MSNEYTFNLNMGLEHELQAALKNLAGDEATSSRLIDSIHDLAAHGADEIKSSSQLPRAIFDQHDTESRERWAKMIPSKRHGTLAAAWTGIPE